MEKKLRVVEIFKSIDGEGPRAGYPATFIRLEGCNLACSYCDSQYACETSEKHQEMTVDEIVEACKIFGLGNITLTGGEPLIHSNIESLITELIIEDFFVSVETNGSISFHDLPNRLFATKQFQVIMDYKCPSSGMEDFMRMGNFQYLRDFDALKFVVGSHADLCAATDIIREMKPKCEIFFSPVFGKIEPVEIVNFIVANKMENCRVQLQLHKFIWEPSKRGV